MAVTKVLPTLKVEIISDGVALEEFTDEDEQSGPDAVTKYIESKAGAEFAIKCTLTPPWAEHSILLQLCLDGKAVTGRYLLQEHFRGDHHEILVQGTRYSENNNWFSRKFSFSDITLDDSGSQAVSDSLMKNLKETGEISIKAFYVKTTRLLPTVSSSKDLGNLSNVPEKALKGRTLSHQTSLQPPEKTRPWDTLDCDYLDANKTPFAKFNFKYRSRAALKSLLVIPRSPSPVPLEQRDIETLTPEESRELIRRLRERDAAAQNIKREGIKRERPPEGNDAVANMGAEDGDEVSFVSSKRRRLPVVLDDNGVETIDLT